MGTLSFENFTHSTICGQKEEEESQSVSTQQSAMLYHKNVMQYTSIKCNQKDKNCKLQQKSIPEKRPTSQPHFMKDIFCGSIESKLGGEV